MGEAKRRKGLKPCQKTPLFPLYHYTFGRRLPFIQDKGLLPVEPEHGRFVWLTESETLDPTSCAALSLNGLFYKGDLAKFNHYGGGVFRISVEPTAIAGLKHFPKAPEVRYLKARDNHGADPNLWWLCREVKPSSFIALAQLTKHGWISLDWTEIDLTRLANLPRIALICSPA